MIVRTPVPADYGPLADLFADLWHIAHRHCVPEDLAALRTRPDFLRRLYGFGDGLIVLGDEGAPKGFAAVVGNELDQLYVPQDLWGAGAADTLVRHALDRIARDGHDNAILKCNPGNLRAAAYYRKSGWADDGLQAVTVDTANGPFVIDCIVFSRPAQRLTT